MNAWQHIHTLRRGSRTCGHSNVGSTSCWGVLLTHFTQGCGWREAREERKTVPNPRISPRPFFLCAHWSTSCRTSISPITRQCEGLASIPANSQHACRLFRQGADTPPTGWTSRVQLATAGSLTKHLIAVSSQLTTSTHAGQVCRALRGSSTTGRWGIAI